MNVKLTRRNFSGNQPLGDILWTVERLDWEAVGGPAFARLRAQAELPRLWDLASWLRCGITVSDNQPAWWGYISTVELHLGARVVRFSLDQMYNRLSVKYYDYTPASNSGELKVTGIYTNQDSANVYGYKERIFVARQQMSSDQAAAYAKTLLNTYSLPIPSPRIDPAEAFDTQPYAIVECRGWWETTGWRFYYDTRGSAGYKVGSTRVNIAEASGQVRLAQSFNAGSAAWSVSEVWSKLFKIGVPAGDLRLDICANSSGRPGSSLAYATLAQAAISADNADWYKFKLSAPLALSARAAYWVVLSRVDNQWDGNNYYCWLADATAGWDGGSGEYYSGVDWAGFVEPVDFAFTAIGYADNGVIMQRICETTQCGQFLAGCRFEPGTTGILSRMYRDGGTRGQDELEEMLQTGASGGVRLLANVDAQRYVRIYQQPTAPPGGRQGLVIGAKGEIARGDGSALPLSEQPAGQWARLGELATVTEMYGYGGAVFIESCTWDGRVLKVTR